MQSGQIDNSIDAGIVALAKIGNFVWEDVDGDGLQDAGEPGISGVAVTLFFSNGTPAGQTTMTDGTGLYQFCVDPGDYYVSFGLPTGFLFTTANAGVNDAIDSDADPVSGITAAVSVQSVEINNTLDAGLVAVAKLGWTFRF